MHFSVHKTGFSLNYASILAQFDKIYYTVHIGGAQYETKKRDIS